MLVKLRKFLQRKDEAARKRKGFTLVELMVAMSIVILLGAAAFFAYGHVQQMRKMAQVTTDMDAIAAACLTYESLNRAGTLPANLAALNTGLTAAQSIDGVKHDNFIQAGTTRPSGSGSTATVSIKDLGIKTMATLKLKDILLVLLKMPVALPWLLLLRASKHVHVSGRRFCH